MGALTDDLPWGAAMRADQHPSRRHHYLPQFYMKAFADDRHKVTVVERAGRSYTTSTANVFVERDYYSVRDESEEVNHELIERGIYAKLESHIAPIYRPP